MTPLCNKQSPNRSGLQQTFLSVHSWVHRLARLNWAWIRSAPCMSPSWNCELHRIYGSRGAGRSSRGQTQTFKLGQTPTSVHWLRGCTGSEWGKYTNIHHPKEEEKGILSDDLFNNNPLNTNTHTYTQGQRELLSREAKNPAKQKLLALPTYPWLLGAAQQRYSRMWDWK